MESNYFTELHNKNKVFYIQKLNLFYEQMQELFSWAFENNKNYESNLAWFEIYIEDNLISSEHWQTGVRQVRIKTSSRTTKMLK